MGPTETALSRWLQENSLTNEPVASSALEVARRLDGDAADSTAVLLAAELRRSVDALRATLTQEDSDDDTLASFLDGIAAPAFRPDHQR